jgi:hypothetical protein
MKRPAHAIGFVVLSMLTAAILVPAVRAQRSTPAPWSARDARAVARHKINERVLSEIYRRRGDAHAKSVVTRGGVRVDRHGRALVDVRAQVRPELRKKMKALGGVEVSSSTTYDSIVGWMPLLTLERLAADSSVRAIEPAQ